MTGVLLDSIIYLQKDVQVLSLKKGKKTYNNCSNCLFFSRAEALTGGLDIKSIQFRKPCLTLLQGVMTY